MKKTLAVLLATAALLLGSVAEARRPTDLTKLLQMLLGGQVSTEVGVLTSTGTAVTPATTAVPFTTSAGNYYCIQCDTAVCFHDNDNATTCTIGVDYGMHLQARQRYCWLAADNIANNNIAMISVSGTSNCAVRQVQ